MSDSTERLYERINVLDQKDDSPAVSVIAIGPGVLKYGTDDKYSLAIPATTSVRIQSAGCSMDFGLEVDQVEKLIHGLSQALAFIADAERDATVKAVSA